MRMGKVKKAAKKFLANGGKAAVLNRKKPGPFKNKAAKAAKAAAKGDDDGECTMCIVFVFWESVRVFTIGQRNLPVWNTRRSGGRLDITYK